MDFSSSNHVIHIFIVFLLLLHTKAISPQLDEKFLEVARFLHSSSTQKPRICQIYSKITNKHIQVFNRRIKALGEDNTTFAKVEIKSYTFGVVTIRGVESQRYICMNKKGKLVARKALVGDGSCRFHEGFAPNYYTTYNNSKYPKWYIGFYKRGTPKRGKKTRRTQDSCQFILRQCDKPHRPTPVGSVLKWVLSRCKTSPKLIPHCHAQKTKRIRRHKTTTAHTETLPKWLDTPPDDKSPLEKSKWVNRVTNYYKQNLNFGSDVVDFDAENRAKCKNRRRWCRKTKNRGRGKRGKRRESSTLPAQPFLGVTTQYVDLRNWETTAFPQTPLLVFNSELDKRETQAPSTRTTKTVEKRQKKERILTTRNPVTNSYASISATPLEENKFLSNSGTSNLTNSSRNSRTSHFSTRKKETKSKRNKKRKKLRNRRGKVTPTPLIT